MQQCPLDQIKYDKLQPEHRLRAAPVFSNYVITYGRQWATTVFGATYGLIVLD